MSEFEKTYTCSAPEATNGQEYESFINDQLRDVRDEIEKLLEEHCPEVDAKRVKGPLEEALSNACIHGNLGISSEDRTESGKFQERLVNITSAEILRRTITVRINIIKTISDTTATINIQDQGKGFNPSEVPDPTLQKNLDRPSGRGMLIMNAFMDDVQFNDKGNSVTMVKKWPVHEEAKAENV